tara:strand:- start:237 stop:620 length:384 start_codon:yes stop_codon:yes gene_type:complete
MARVDAGANVLRVQKFTYDHSVQGDINASTSLTLGSLPDNAIIIGTHIDTTVASGTSGGPISVSLKVGAVTIVNSSTGTPFHSVAASFENDVVKLSGAQDVTLTNGSGSHKINAGVHTIFIQYYQGV